MKPPFDHHNAGGATTIKPIFLSKSQREQQSLHDHHQQRREKKEITASRHEQQQQEQHQKNLSYERRKRKARDEEEKEQERDLIKQNYLGRTNQQPPKKKKRFLNDKSRFCFDWDNNEDTSSLHHNRPPLDEEAVLLFGRGFLAGMDRREQKNKKKKMVADRHWAEKKLEEMNERDWRIFKEHHHMSYKGGGGGSKIPRPMRSWAECRLSSFQLLKAVERAGFKNPTPIQMAAIPLGLQQRDVIGVSETGSGKTVAFVLPMLNYISRLRLLTSANDDHDHSELEYSGEEEAGPYAVVMAPTRELAQQIENETVKFAQFMDKGSVRVVSIVGGQSIEEQGFKIMQGCEVVIATPGRLLDCLERRLIVLNRCNYVVLDEADRMIDMGFEQQVMGVLDQLPCTNLKPENEFVEELDDEKKKIYRTTYMFSATMPPAVERLARKYLRNPVVVTIDKATSRRLISQHIIMVKESEKMFRLHRLLDEDVGDDKTVIVFVNTKKAADSLFKGLDKAGYNVTTFHGGKSQEQREISLKGFRNKKYNVLVATDVAGRGIDIPDVAHVINFDMPDKIEMYTHRIGRTGRAGKSGVATTLLTLHDSQVFYDLKQLLVQSNSHVPSELARHEASKLKPGTIPDRPPRRSN